MFLYKVKVCAIRVFFYNITCAVNAVSSVSWFACANVRAVSVVTESMRVALMLSCVTLVYVCKIVNKMHLEESNFY